MEATERALFESGIRHVTGSTDGARLDAALEDLGWRDALAADRATAVSVLFEAQGATATSSAALDRLLAGALAAEAADVADVAVVLPSLGGCDAPGTLARSRCLVRGLGSSAFDRCAKVLVAAKTAGGTTAFAVDPSALQCRPVRGLDPALGLIEVTGEFAPAAATEQTTADWAAAMAVGQLALGHELLGTGRAMLELARTHALERLQFGRPIASFQAVRHRLAESLVALEAAAALLDATWDEPSAVASGMAKAFAGRSVRAVSRHSQQVLAGIGFTTEHPLHLFVRRAIVLDQLLGAGNVLTRQLGTDVLQRATLPAAFPL